MAGPPPIPAGPVRPGDAIEVDRTVNACGQIALAGRQHPIDIYFAGRRIQAGIAHADRTLTVGAADTTWRVYDGGQLITEVPRTTKPIARSKARKPEPRRRQRARETPAKP